MALAKYHEEIAERWLTNNSPRLEAHMSGTIDRFPPRAAQAGEVYLVRDGGRMEDIEVCAVGSPFLINVAYQPDIAEPVIECEDDTGRLRRITTREKTAELRFDRVGTRRLQVASSGYVKPYVIHVVEPFHVEQLPDFASLIRGLTDNPPLWTDESFISFRQQLEITLDRPEVPALFIEGLVEYHLGLHFQERCLQSAKDRFQSAYGALRWFIPYSDIARLICTYYLYGTNEFEAAGKLCVAGHSRLADAIDFFRIHLPRVVEDVKKTKRGYHGLPLLIAQSDVLCFQAVQAIRESKWEEAQELTAIARKDTRRSFHRERAFRIEFLEACVKEMIEGPDAARSLFELLSDCPWTGIADAAQRHITK